MALPSRIETPDFILRAWSVDDASALATALHLSEAHLRKWTPWVVDGREPGLSIEDRLRRHADDFAAATEWVYGMFSPNSADVLGACGLYPRVGPRAVEIGYWLSARHTGRGLATQATAILTRLAFADPAIDRVEIRCDVGNVASAGVPRRLGYSTEHITSSANQGVGEETAPHGLIVWRLTRAQFAAQRPSQGAENA
jgi:RimJ/RimL family protein N-acetyltransferase